MDYVGVKRFDADGKLVGERRFCGLFTSTAYTRSTRAIPYLRRKVDHIIRRAGFDQYSHSGKALVNVLETYPRDELFQIDEDTLYHFALAILQLDERPRVRVLAAARPFRPLRFGPRLRAARPLRQPHQGGDRRLSRHHLQGPRARLLSVLSRRPAGARALHHRALRGRDAEPRSATCSTARWKRSCAAGSTASTRRSPPRMSRREAHGLLARYRDAFPVDYREVYPPATAVGDLRVLESLTPERPLGVDLYRGGRRGADARRAEGLQPEPADFAVRARAGAGKHGLPRRRRAHLSHPAAGRARGLVSRHGAGKRVRPADRSVDAARSGWRSASSRS